MRTLLCQCGCGESFETNAKGLPTAYKSGHPVIYCVCGCGKIVIQKRKKPSRLTHYLRGHHRLGKSNTWSIKPDSQNLRTAREKSHTRLNPITCELSHIGGCLGEVECHHLDGNPLNVDLSNLVALCRAHHRLLHLGRITLKTDAMPEFRTDGSGKRRYKWPK